MRRYGGGGLRGPWEGDPSSQRRPFERIDGTVMSQEEIARVGATPKDAPQPKRKGGHAGVRITDDELVRTLHLVALDGRSKAARELGMTTAGVRSRLSIAEARGLKMASVALDDEKIVQVPAERLDSGVGGDRKAIGAVIEEALGEAFLKGASEAAGQPVIAIVHGGSDPEDRMRAFSEGFDTAVDQLRSAPIEALFDYLTHHGPEWSKDEAERWFWALRANVELVYPAQSASA